MLYNQLNPIYNLLKNYDEWNRNYHLYDFEPLFSHSHFELSFNLYHDNKNIMIITALPGIKKDEIELSFDEDHIIIETKENQQYQQKISLPHKIDIDTIQAKMEDGILKITMSKTEKIEPKKITIQ